MKQAKFPVQGKTGKARPDRKASIRYPERLETPTMEYSLKSWQGVARSGLRPPKHTPKYTGSRRG